MDPITLALALASQFGPSVVKWITGDDKAATVAASVIDAAKAVTGKTDAAEITAALAADPVLAVQFRGRMAELDHEMEAKYLADRQDARARDVAIIQAGQRNTRANVMAAAALLLVIVCLAVVVAGSDINEFAKGAVTLILGRALGWVEQVFSFEFGTTRLSRTKDDTINNLSK